MLHREFDAIRFAVDHVVRGLRFAQSLVRPAIWLCQVAVPRAGIPGIGTCKRATYVIWHATFLTLLRVLTWEPNWLYNSVHTPQKKEHPFHLPVRWVPSRCMYLRWILPILKEYGFKYLPWYPIRDKDGNGLGLVSLLLLRLNYRCVTCLHSLVPFTYDKSLSLG